jgi:hypothetical protein
LDSSQAIVYILQFAGFSGFVWYFTRNLSKYRIERIDSYLVWMASVFFSLISCAIIQWGFEMDALLAFNDAKFIYASISEDFLSRVWMVFLTGGNSFYPKSYFQILDASNSWSHIASWTTMRVYLLFIVLSKASIWNVSIFFAFLSWSAKINILKIYNLWSKQSISKILFWFILVGGTDIFFISGLYKETIFFACLMMSLWLFLKSNRKWLEHFALIVCIYVMLNIKFDVFVILISPFFIYRAAQYWRNATLVRKLWSAIVVSFIVGLLTYQYLWPYLLLKKLRFSNKASGNTVLEGYQWSNSMVENFANFTKHFLGVFYTSFFSNYELRHLNIIGFVNLLTLIFLFFLAFRIQIQPSLRKKWLLMSCVIGFSIIAFYVPNYITQLRYRSIYMILFVFWLFLNQKHIKENHM